MTGSARTTAVAPRRNLQIKFAWTISEKKDFVAYVDASRKIGWHAPPAGVENHFQPVLGRTRRAANLNPQLVCYSWMMAISEVALACLRPQALEVQYLRTTITNEQRAEFGQLVEDTIHRVESVLHATHVCTAADALGRAKKSP